MQGKLLKTKSATHAHTLSQVKDCQILFYRAQFNYFTYIKRLSMNHVHTCTHKPINHSRTLTPVVLHKDQILKATSRNYINIFIVRSEPYHSMRKTSTL